MSDEPKEDAIREMAELIGHINMAWNDTQFYVYDIFHALMGGDLVRSEAIFFALRADSTQRDITSSLATTLLKYAIPDGLEKEAGTHFAKLGKLAGRRNDAIHSMFSFREGAIVYEPSRPRLAGKDIKAELTESLREIKAACMETYELSRKIRAAFVPQPTRFDAQGNQLGANMGAASPPNNPEERR